MIRNISGIAAGFSFFIPAGPAEEPERPGHLCRGRLLYDCVYSRPRTL